MTSTLTLNFIINEIKIRKQELVNEFGITKLAIFGSFTKDKQTNTSDIDILVDMKDRNYFQLIALENHLSKLFNNKVDLGYFSSLNTFIKNDIQKDLIYV